MRLINADELKNTLSHYEIEDNIFIDEIEMYIDDTPTAFDIDKIIEELEKVKSDVHTPADIVWNNAVEMCTSVFNRLINEV